MGNSANRVGERLPEALHESSGDGPCCRNRDSLADHGTNGELEAIHAGGHLRPGRVRTRSPSTWSRPSCAETDSGSASRSRRRRQRATAAVRSRRSSSRSRQRIAAASGCSSTTPPPYSRDRERRGVDGANRVVELAHAAEARRQSHLHEGDLGGLDQQPRGLRALGPRERHRAGTPRPGESAGAGARCSRAAPPGPALPRDRPHPRRSGERPGRRRRRAGSRPASPAPRRDRLQARRPASCAAAALWKRRTLRRLGSRAGQLGRQ